MVTYSEPLPRNCEYVTMFIPDFPAASQTLLLLFSLTKPFLKKDQVFIKVKTKVRQFFPSQLHQKTVTILQQTFLQSPHDRYRI